MSSMEYVIGKLLPVKMKDSLEETMVELIRDNYPKQLLPQSVDREDFMELLGDQYLILEDKIYKIDAEYLEEAGSRMGKNEDGSFEFQVSFYNGGTCLQEMLEDCLRMIGG